MSNDTLVFENSKHVAIKENQVLRFLEFIDNAESSFENFKTMIGLIIEKSERHTTAYTLSAIALDMIDDWETACQKEKKFFKTNSPELFAQFSEELAQ